MSGVSGTPVCVVFGFSTVVSDSARDADDKKDADEEYCAATDNY